MDSDYYAGQAEQGVEGAEARLAESRARLDSAERQLATANEVHSAWLKLAGALGLVILVLLLYDAARMGALIPRCRAIQATLPPPRQALVIERGGRLSPPRNLHPHLPRPIGAINGFPGHSVPSSSALAAAAYY